MAIANLFGRGIGFGAPHWIVTRGYESGTVVIPVLIPSPHRLAYELEENLLDFEGIVPTLLAFDPVETFLTFETADGAVMSTPLVFTATETGPITLRLTGADGSVPDLTTAQTVTFSLQNQAGTLVVSAVALTSLTAAGTGVWTRTTLQVATSGDYIGQAKVVDSGGNIAFYPDAKGQGGFSGSAITMLRPVGG